MWLWKVCKLLSCCFSKRKGLVCLVFAFWVQYSRTQKRFHLSPSFFLPAVKVIQPYRVVSTNGTAQVQCFIQPRPSYHQIQPPIDQSQLYPYPSPEELRVTLLKGLHGTEKFCSSILNYTEKNKTGVEKEEEVSCGWMDVIPTLTNIK